MGTLHDLLEAKGKQAVRELVEGRRGARVVEAAASWATDEDIGTGTCTRAGARPPSRTSQLKKHAVPLHETAIKHIRNSSMALDVYCWLAYRLHALTAAKPVSWAALAGQFGAGIKLRKHFKPAFLESLAFALAVYRDARVEVTETDLLLHPSQPPVRKLLRQG